ncbi:cytosine permease [Aeromicrobium senzhongii]|uniref:Cytosine permease n=1 Tax=Aeromicrobium senzhongii TaxID=2663859 RepID=A0ABX6SV96_9ACTN|nr:cytosine permease [Aeromicrobium senzhongii]MTB87987.1 allantoin permease [Aeromicrobium senzhongii]QNL95001.1 cytosine permease [Aeromicrobium senzhongii]
MTVQSDGPGGLEAVRRAGIETTGIEIVDESERTAKPSDLFWPWFAANVSVFGISYGSYLLWAGISWWQASLVAVVGITVSFIACGLVAIAGKRGSAPTMILSRAPFGVVGQKLPGVFSWIISIGWETFLAIMATLATATVFRELGWSSGTTTKVLAMAVIAALIVAASVAGYHVIIRFQSVLTWLTGLATIVYIALTLDQIDIDALTAMPNGSMQAVVGAFVMVMTAFGFGWINIAADWSRYQRRGTSGGRIVLWNTIGGALAPVVLVLYGIMLAGSRPDLQDGIANDPIGTLATILPTWFLVPFLVASVLALVSGAVLGIYSSGLTLLSLGVKIPRPAAAFVDGVILTLGTIYVVFVAQTFLAPFQSFLITLGVPIGAWAGIVIADIALRKHDYDEPALFDPKGRYGAVNWPAIATLVGASVVGWGLVVNAYPADVTWNNWQGYLLEPLNLAEWNSETLEWSGAWAFANLGVLFAFVIGFVVTLVVQRGRVRRQESV